MTADPLSPGLRVAVSNLLHVLTGGRLLDRFAACIFPVCNCTGTCHMKDR